MKPKMNRMHIPNTYLLTRALDVFQFSTSVQRCNAKYNQGSRWRASKGVP
ncbi:hypothetical protein F9C07_10312 [Aspergillus flavus]|uniref:Uncharacterized protein n=1 Tax=Aspergillus flavus (strain ATCC 200026 / FGSC A1120 / IAM 13836 / NRRL 3357 / JCM 12722 / SRRC 167) TaxID=332952 RepID=A0A7U2MW33_ASPFN|nr:hypothetical protein F9C07_10312 [Aspergillus flavus]